MERLFLFLFLAPGILISQQPNILIIMADDVDVEAFQAYATNPVNTSDAGTISTPNIDALAGQGLRFTNAFTTPLCTPTRVMLLTGQSNRRNYRAFGYLDNDQTTFAQVLRANGYTTAIAGKWQLSDPDGNSPIAPSGAIAPNITPAVMRDDYGFDSYLLWQLNYTTGDKGSRYWEPKLESASGDGLSSILVPTGPSNYGPDLFAQHLKDFMTDAASTSTPFLAYYAMALPHDPWVSTPDAPGATSGDDEQYFDENIEYIDKLVGELVAHLDDPDGNPGTSDSIRENTIIIFTSDNGTSPRITINNAERGNVTGDKGTATYDGTHVPFILDWGSKTPASMESRMLDLSDIFPTILKVAGIPDAGLILDGQPIIDATGTVLDNKPASYIWYDPKGRPFPPDEFAQNQTYKLYKDGRFFKIDTDKQETTNLNDGSLTTEEQSNFDTLLAVLSAWDPPPPEGMIPPDDSSVSENLLLWLKDPEQMLSGNTWHDASGNGNDVTGITSISGYTGTPTLSSVSPGSGAFAGNTVRTVLLDDNEIMGAPDIGGVIGFTDLTILSVYSVSSTGSGTRPMGIGSKTVEGTTNNHDRLNLATDTSIRYDDGSNIGSVTNHPTHLVLRITRLSNGSTASDWFDLGSGLTISLDEASVGSGSSNGTAAPTFRTKNDDFYLGEISANVGTDDPSTASYEIAQVAMYDTSLTDDQVIAITDWIRNVPDGNPGDAWRLLWFGTPDNTGNAADDFDFDKDGLVNLLERAFGANPITPDSADFLPTTRTVDSSGNPGADYLSLSYRRLAGGVGATGNGYAANSLSYTIQHSTSLNQSWTSGNFTVLAVNDDTPVAGIQTVSLRLNNTFTEAPKQFVRLKVQESP